MKPNVITDCNNCSHKEVCGMKDAPQKTREKISEGLGDWLARDKMEISIRCPHYMGPLGIGASSESVQEEYLLD